MIGEKINEYIIKSELGEGGMATVYLAYDENFKREVALKVLKLEFIHNPNIRKRFVAEARSMFKLHHPNIVKVFDLIDAGDVVAFTMEYVRGETLKQLIEREGALEDGSIKDFLFQILDALGYMHENGLIHRDLKPSNFLVSDDVIKITDFGIAKYIDSQDSEYTMTGTTQQLGSPFYMSPEQVKSSKELNKQTDIYSLGVVLWYMVKGENPFGRDLSLFELQLKIVESPLLSTSSKFDKLIEEMTKKSIEERIKDVSSIKDFLKKTKPSQKRADIEIKSNSKGNDRMVNISLSVLIPLIIIIMIIAAITRSDSEANVNNFPIESDEANLKVSETNQKKNNVYDEDKGYEDSVIDDEKSVPKDSTSNITRVIDLDGVKLVQEPSDLVRMGDFYGGGVVISVNNTGTHGLIASEKDIGSRQCFKAASAAEKYSMNGYNDWYLPNRDELRIIYNERKYFESWRYALYVNSHLINAEHGEAERIDFTSGLTHVGNGYEYSYVWPVRRF